MSRKRALVCEDDRGVRTLLEKVLRRRDADVVSVTSGASAIDHLADASFDVLLLDLLTPGVNGYDVLDYLDNHRPAFLSRVIVVSGVSTSRGVVPGRVAAILRKPFELQQLEDALTRVFQSRLTTYSASSDQHRAET